MDSHTTLSQAAVKGEITLAGKHSLPTVQVVDEDASGNPVLREEIFASKRSLREQKRDVYRQIRRLKQSPEKGRLFQEIHFYENLEAKLELQHEKLFVPHHGPNQFLAPRAFFQSSLFNARNRKVARCDIVEPVLITFQNQPPLFYRGPELRQSDALVFMSILNMLRDVRAGTKALIQPAALCSVLFGRYDGNSRKQLSEHLLRLQQAFIITESLEVPLCKDFEHPYRGTWSVALHPSIVELFKLSPRVWLPIEVRMKLPEGLPTWLYSYIESQTHLIPMNIEKIRELSGSNAEMRAFKNSLRKALKLLVEHKVLESAWSLRDSKIKWLKKFKVHHDAVAA